VGIFSPQGQSLVVWASVLQSASFFQVSSFSFPHLLSSHSTHPLRNLYRALSALVEKDFVLCT
jgi:hypothetical protein